MESCNETKEIYPKGLVSIGKNFKSFELMDFYFIVQYRHYCLLKLFSCLLFKNATRTK